MPHRPPRIFAALVLAAALTGAGAVTGHAALGSGPAVPSASVSAAPSDPGPPNPSPYPPTTPAGLTVTALHARSVDLSWTASRPGCCTVDHYVILYGAAFDDVRYATPVGDVTSATVTSGIVPLGQYTFQVAAVDSVNHQSGASNAVTVVTPVSDTASDRTPPSTPAGLVVSGTGPSGAVLAWSPATDDVGVAGYNVYRFDGWYTSSLLTRTSATTFTAPLTTGRNIFYVRARDAAGNLSIASNTVDAGTGTPPPTTAPPPTPVCAASYRPLSNWPGGFTAEVTVTNTGPASLDGWSAHLTLGGDQQIASAWNGTFQQTGPSVTLTPVAWNHTLAPGGTATVGLIGSWHGSNATPADLTCGG